MKCLRNQRGCLKIWERDCSVTSVSHTLCRYSISDHKRNCQHYSSIHPPHIPQSYPVLIQVISKSYPHNPGSPITSTDPSSPSSTSTASPSSHTNTTPASSHKPPTESPPTPKKPSYSHPPPTNAQKTN